MTTNDTKIVSALQELIRGSNEGLVVREMQLMLWDKFKLKLSYKDIEQTLIHNSELFNERDWKWIIRQV